MQDALELLPSILPIALTGTVVQSDGLATSVAGLPAPVGAVVEIERQTGPPLRGEVIGFRNRTTIVHPYGDVTGIRHGNRVRLVRTHRSVRVSQRLLGRVVNAHLEPVDGLGTVPRSARVPLLRRPPDPVQRPRIDQVLTTGIRAIDSLLTCGRGQRLGIFSASGVGKSILLGMLARNTAADINVIALLGERGREVNEFIERDLGPEGRARSVVVVATSDEPAVIRIQAAQAATAVAEYFRDQGQHVLLMMDSLTRFAMAQREIGLAAGEPPTTRGYPPSVFSLLPRLVERAGLTAAGSITGFYSVLVEGDDPNEPVSDTVRGLLDGHILLSRKLAHRAHYPAIDPLTSISRLMTELVPPAHLAAANTIRRLLAVYLDHEDLISIGAYRAGSNPALDGAIAVKTAVDRYLQQAQSERADWEATCQQLVHLAGQYHQAAEKKS